MHLPGLMAASPMLWCARALGIASLVLPGAGRSLSPTGMSRPPGVLYVSGGANSGVLPGLPSSLRLRCLVRRRSDGEQVAEPSALREVPWGQEIVGVGPDAVLVPPPDGLGAGAEPPGYPGPRHSRYLPEPHQPLREVVGEDIYYSAVVSALSRHLAGFPQGLARALPPSVHSWSWANPLSGRDRRPARTSHVCCPFCVFRPRGGGRFNGRPPPYSVTHISNCTVSPADQVKPVLSQARVCLPEGCRV